MSVLFNSSLVVWRECFEAMLVVYLLWLKMKDHSYFQSIKKTIVLSVVISLAASFALGTLAMRSEDFFDSQTLAYLQGVLPIVAAVLMLQMIVWMSKHAVEIKTKIADLSRKKSSILIAVFALLFITIVREAFETVVFLTGIAMSFEDKAQAITTIGSGMGIGFVLSLLTIFAMAIGKRWLNLAIFFTVTNLVLLYIAANMLSAGISQLIDLDLIPLFNIHYAFWAFISLGAFFLRKQIAHLVGVLVKGGFFKKASFVFALLWAFDSKAEFNFKGLGVIDYRKFQTFKTINSYDPYDREQFDLSEFELEGEFLFDNGNELEFEIEIEHGGTGTAYEFEPLEEFGEFESEIEKGGEVVLSEISYFKRFNKSTGLRIGKFPLTIGLGTVMGNAKNNIGIKASRLEQNMLPVGWNEIGVQLEHKWQDLRTRVAIVNGLNSEFFRTYNWIGGGYQRHFEEINTEDKAVVTTLEYGNVEYQQGIALSYYEGNSSKNRFKTDKLNQSAVVRIYSLMGNYRVQDFTFMGQYVYGSLSNSAAVIDANSTLGGLAKPKAFASLGSEAVLRTFQVSYDYNEALAFYGKTEFVNTFFNVADSVSELPRYSVTYHALGARWVIDEHSLVKFESGIEKTKLDGLPETRHYALSFVMDFSSAD